MALLDSSDFTGGTVTHDAALKEYIITGAVRVVNAALTAPTGGWGGYRIICRSSGGLRFTGNAAKLLGGAATSLIVIEEDDAHRYGGDNYQGQSARFAGVVKVSNVVWIVEDGLRSDFDIWRGSTDNGANGPAVEFNGLYLIQRGDERTYNHYASANTKITVNPHTGFGWQLRNETQGHQMEFTNPPADGVEIAGLGVDTGFTPALSADGAQIAFGGATGTVFNIDGLNAASVSSTGNNITVNLNNPVGSPPTVTNDWSGYNGTFNVFRDVPLNISGVAVPANTVVHATATSSGGVNATGTASGSSGNVRVRTDQSPNGSSNGNYNETRNFDLQMVGLPFQKFSTSTTVANSPAAVAAALTPDLLPDGTAITAFSSGDVGDAGELYRALKTWAVANRNEPDASSPLVTLSSAGAIVLDTDAEIRLATSQTDLVDETSNGVYSVRCETTGVDPSNGITLLDAGTANTIPSGTKTLLGFPTRDSTGTSCLLNISAPISYVSAYKNDASGTQLGVQNLTSAGTASFLIPTTNTGTDTKVGCWRNGYTPQGRDVDTSAGGTINISFSDLVQEVDPLGAALYDSSANKTGISVSFTLTGQPTIGIPNRSCEPKDIYRALHDQYNNPLGAKFAAFQRQPLGILATGGALANAVFLGSDIQFRRASSSGSSAGVNAFVLGGRNSTPVNEDRGPIQLGGSISSGGGGGISPSDLAPVTEAVAAVSTKVDTVIRQNEHVATSLPLDFPEGSPLSPLCAVQGLAGQEVIRDVESRAYPVTPSAAVGIATDASGVHSFTGSGSHIDYTLTRAVDGVSTQFTKEIITLFQIRPTSFHATEASPIFSIGALVVSIAPSTGTTAAVRVGATGTNDTTALLTLNEWNTIVFSVEQRDGNSNYPKMRISVNGAAQQAWNLDSNENFASIASGTTNFRLGARSSGNTSFGFTGDMRAMFMHPNNEVYNSGAGWTIPAGIDWDNYLQIYTGASLMDRVEGVLSDVYEPIVDEINEKTYSLEDTANAVLSQPFSRGITASDDIGVGADGPGNLTALLKYMSTNAPSGGGASADDIWNALMSSHTTAGSFGAKLGSLVSSVLAQGTQLFNAPFTANTAVAATTGSTLPQDNSGNGWGVGAGQGVLSFNPNGTGALQSGSLLFGTRRNDFTDLAELDFVFQHLVSDTHANDDPQPVAQLVNEAGNVIFSIEVKAGTSAPTYSMKITDGGNSSSATLASSTTQDAWHTIAVSIRQDGTHAEVRATFDGGSTATTLNVSSNVRPLDISDAPRMAFIATSYSDLRNVFFCPLPSQSSSTGWTPGAGISWNENRRTYTMTDGSALSSVPTPNNLSVSDLVNGVWNAQTSAHQQTGSFGEHLDAIATSSETNNPSAAQIANAVLDRDLSGHDTGGTVGAKLNAVYTGTPPTAAAIADQVWDEQASGHATSGSFGAVLSAANATTPPDAASIATAVRDVAISGAAANSLGAKISSLDNAPTTDQIVTAVLAGSINPHTTLGTAIDVIGAAVAGKATLSGATTTFKELGGEDDRVAVTVGSQAGERTASLIITS